jgi:hypothetical protein
MTKLIPDLSDTWLGYYVLGIAAGLFGLIYSLIEGPSGLTALSVVVLALAIVAIRVNLGKRSR